METPRIHLGRPQSHLRATQGHPGRPKSHNHYSQYYRQYHYHYYYYYPYHYYDDYDYDYDYDSIRVINGMSSFAALENL